jgi:hypothetical protein
VTSGVRPADPQLVEYLARMRVGETFVIDQFPVGMTSPIMKTIYNQAARVAGIHLRWRRGANPITAKVVVKPTFDELRAERRRIATRIRRAELTIKREELASAQQVAKQRVTATLALVEEVKQIVGLRAPQSGDVWGDAAVLVELGKRLKCCTTVQELGLMMGSAYAALQSPVGRWTAATRQCG